MSAADPPKTDGEDQRSGEDTTMTDSGSDKAEIPDSEADDAPAGGLEASGTPDSASARNAIPALVIGLVAVVLGIAGVATQQPILGLLAGALALLAALVALRLSRRLEEQGAVQHLVEEELATIRREAAQREQVMANQLQLLAVELEGVATKLEAAKASGLGLDQAVAQIGGGDQLVDRETGLCTERFFRLSLDGRVASARRHLRPVAVALLEVVEGLPQNEPLDTNPTKVAEAIRSTLREADTACRLNNGNFGLLLEDTPENGAIWTVERIRRCLSESHEGLTLWAGVACYPAHAFSPGEILTAADRALVMAREWRQDRIEVAVAAAD